MAAEITLTHFFRLDGKDVADAVALGLRGSPALHGLAAAPGAVRAYAAESAAAALKSALDVPLKDILAAGWRLRTDLLPFRDDAAKHPPGEVADYALKEHEISSTSRIRFELVLDDVPIEPQLDIEMKLSLVLKAAKLMIKDGRIVAARVGSLKGAGTLTCGRVTLAERQGSEELELPGELAFGEGVAIGGAPPPAPKKRRTKKSESAIA